MKNLLFCLSVFISSYLFAQPGNNTCTAISSSYLLSSNSSCVATTGTIASATNDGGTACPGTERGDVWYRFIAETSNPTITLSNLGSNFTNPGLQIIQTCGGSSIVCGGTSITPTTLSIGTTYYIRVFTKTNPVPSTNAGFTICITNPSVPLPLSSVIGGRMKEVFKQTILSAANVLNDPWEITYGPDGYLWITEAKGYKVYRMDPVTGAKDMVLDISSGSTFLPSPSDSLNRQFPSTQNPWPQGGLAGLALYPNFLDPDSAYVYISYIHRFLGGSSPSGLFYRNKLVRFLYNSTTKRLESPVVLCDTLPGSKDHNSQRIIIAPVVKGGKNYLFYGEGDMGAGQFENRTRTNNAQKTTSYEGKILRFNLVPDGDAGAAAWIPNDNPYSATSAVWSIGIRNNQGFAYDTALNILYGSSHGPYSDDEINIIQGAKNYGHPLIEGFAADHNCDGTSAGSAPGMGSPQSCPMITDEVAAAAAIGPSYKDPLFSAYPNSVAVPSIADLYNTTNGANAQWPSEAWSGIDLYTHTYIPGWNKSLVAASLKWGRLIRLRLDATGTATVPNNNVNDTISYLGSTNRYRDLAFAPNGKDMYVIMDKSSTTSGPSAANPIVPACGGCVQKYTFLGYADNGGKSSIPTSIDVTAGTAGQCNTGTTVVINADNNNLWVPITGPDGNIMAEIYANGQNLDTITSSFYINSGAIRSKSGARYLDRNMTITPKVQPSIPVKIRLYLSKAEFDALDADPLSSISSLTDLKILKNSDACGSAVSGNTTLIDPQYSEAHGANGYMLQASISGFSSFYFGAANITLPLNLLTFTGSLNSNNTTLLKWRTANEINASYFGVERSADGVHFTEIGTVNANGSSSSEQNYSFTDNTVSFQQSMIVYYRLKMTDVDGGYKYSVIITVSLADITGKVTVMPNPVTHEARITFSSPQDGNLSYKIIDNAGRTLLQNSLQVKKGVTNTVSVNMSNFAPGLYYLNVSGAGMNQSLKLQKL